MPPRPLERKSQFLWQLYRKQSEKTVKRLLSVGIAPDEAPIEARLILQRVCNVTPETLLANHSTRLSPDQYSKIQKIVNRRLTREPLSYILGERDFYGRTFQIDRRVLIPRPETELLIDLCVDFVTQNGLNNPRICDIGTGSGIIAITLANTLPNARITATDISSDALEIAQTNATKHNANIEFVLEDATRSLPRESFDIIVSNPPYIRSDVLTTLEPEVRDWEPRIALDGGTDGMDILRPMIHALPKLLRDEPPTAAFIEIDPPVATLCLQAARASFPNAEIQIHRDYAGLERVLAIFSV